MKRLITVAKKLIHGYVGVYVFRNGVVIIDLKNKIAYHASADISISGIRYKKDEIKSDNFPLNGASSDNFPLNGASIETQYLLLGKIVGVNLYQNSTSWNADMHNIAIDGIRIKYANGVEISAISNIKMQGKSVLSDGTARPIYDTTMEGMLQRYEKNSVIACQYG